LSYFVLTKYVNTPVHKYIYNPYVKTKKLNTLMKNAISSQKTNPIEPDRIETSLAKRKAEKMHTQPISTNSNSTSCSSTNAQVLPPNGFFLIIYYTFVYLT